MTPEEYEAAFHGIDLPPTMQLDQGVSISDVPAFLEKELAILKTSTSPRIIDTVTYRLDLALRLLSI